MLIYNKIKVSLSGINGKGATVFPSFYSFSFIVILFLTWFQCRTGFGQAKTYAVPELTGYEVIITGAARTDLYLPLLENRTIGLVCNHTSRIGKTHLVDTLLQSGVDVKVIFSPEHGFRGNAEAGAALDDTKDMRTGLPVISLYGKKKKPLQEDLAGIDVILFDIQDVGVRFYTYISTLALVMEAAAEKGIPVMVADRPNPNGFYIDGPVLDKAFRSFVGMHPVPVVYGMTIGEYAMMIDGEGWLKGMKCDLTVIPLENYERRMMVKLPLAPSPNLPDWQSVYLYPSLCLFEGTIISVGRGTETPFRIIGHPDYRPGTHAFTPVCIPGVSDNPPYANLTCLGLDLTDYALNYPYNQHPFNLEWILSMYRYFKDKEDFFIPYFDKLAGTDRLRLDMESGKTEWEIRRSWENELDAFRQVRKKYLLYPDFD
jgi:uncharacterized protein YbbC (DUF1343 family)